MPPPSPAAARQVLRARPDGLGQIAKGMASRLRESLVARAMAAIDISDGIYLLFWCFTGDPLQPAVPKPIRLGRRTTSAAPTTTSATEEHRKFGFQVETRPDPRF